MDTLLEACEVPRRIFDWTNSEPQQMRMYVRNFAKNEISVT